MERILYSNSIPSRFNNHHHQKSPCLPRLARVDSPRKLLTPPSPSSPSFSRRFIPLYCALHDSNSISPKRSGDENLFLSPDSVNGSEPEPQPHFVKQIGQILLSQQQQKVLKAGTVILLSAVLLTLLHPAIVPPAFASFPSVATAGGSRLIQNELLSSSWAGFFAGCLHTLSGPDHLAALAPLSIGRTRMESAAVGALWGCGHDAGQVIFGLLFLLLKDRLHIEVIRTWGSIVVGITLLVIGALGIKEAIEVPAPCVTMENGVSGYDVLTSQPTGKKKIGFATFATGIVHGLQPDALMMIVPALALPSRLAGAAFLLMFLVGTVIAMGSYTVFIGSCSQALKERVPRITEKLTWASSLIAIALGLSLLVSQFFGFSLY